MEIFEPGQVDSFPEDMLDIFVVKRYNTGFSEY